MMFFPCLFVHLLLQVLVSTLDTPEEIDKFWKGCQEEHGFAASPNRFAVEILKSLLCQMWYDNVVMAMERKCGWDALLSPDTQHHATALLAREMSCVSLHLHSWIFRHLLRLLSTQEPRWDLPALAFLLEPNSQVQQVSILLYQALVTLPLEKVKKALKTHMQQSLLPLFIHCHNENAHVAQASQETLICVAKFLKRRTLKQLVKKEQLSKFAECLPLKTWKAPALLLEA
ncbi:uncharacterized protein LOC117011328 isoform X2 [Catharus ustulatus]|uniref:uncharacterized protein LOC117011328 isoform X2 n=1 Tax=Catharus ustulatus TaxID=91951 RepID=UPI0014081112|nr:uncharacterized protein LOC117011328 isoform X2 [Catharus ustulatus]